KPPPTTTAGAGAPNTTAGGAGTPTTIAGGGTPMYTAGATGGATTTAGAATPTTMAGGKAATTTGRGITTSVKTSPRIVAVGTTTAPSALGGAAKCATKWSCTTRGAAAWTCPLMVYATLGSWTCAGGIGWPFKSIQNSATSPLRATTVSTAPF